MGRFQEKLAFVTGGSEGIGKETAKALVKEGAHVVILARSLEKLDVATKEMEVLRTNPNQKILARSLDVTDEAQVQKLLTSLIAENGTPDFVINCAGYARPGYLQDLETEHFRKMMDLNFFGILYVCKTVVPYLVKEKKGHIVNTSSMAGFIGLFGYTGYCASKYAVVGFSEALRRELEPFGIKVSVLCPPNTKTPGLDQENKFKPAEVLKTEEKAKPVGPEAVAKETVKALGKKDFFIVPTFDGRLAHSLSRLAPRLLHQFVKRQPTGVDAH